MLPGGSGTSWGCLRQSHKRARFRTTWQQSGAWREARGRATETHRNTNPMGSLSHTEDLGDSLHSAHEGRRYIYSKKLGSSDVREGERQPTDYCT